MGASGAPSAPLSPQAALPARSRWETLPGALPFRDFLFLNQPEPTKDGAAVKERVFLGEKSRGRA